jgi:hypothetical protein
VGRWGKHGSNPRILPAGPCGFILVLIAGMAVAAALTGCSSQPAATSAPSASTTSSSAAVSTTVTTLSTTSTEEATSSSTTTGARATTVTISPDAIAYATSLGGTSHEGETLYFVIGASVDSEQAAQTMLEDATPLFGDMQSYFIVQLSDNFEGMEPGWWVVIEAYRGEPSAENLDFDRRGFSDAYVKQATVKTADPIPVYEEVVGGV